MPLGLYVSRCSGLVDSVVDIETSVAGVRNLVSVLRVFDDVFDSEVQQRMTLDVAEAELDAVVIAGHSTEHYARSLSGQHLKERLVEAGVNPNRVVTANILEHVALAHPKDAVGATAKAAAMIRVACLRAVLSEPHEVIETQPRQSVLILGATTEGLVAAQRLLQLGYSVVVADREDGNERVRNAHRLRATVAFVRGHPAADFLDQAHLVDGSGWLGDYEITLSSPSGEATHRVGGILLARPDDADWIAELRRHFRVDIDENGHARSLDPSTHPAETVVPGLMVVPIRESSDEIKTKVAAADSAVLALALKLSQPAVQHPVDVSQVDEGLCGGCASCVKTCAFGACSIGEDGQSHVDVRRCRGCGKCVVSCPVGARDIVNSPHDYLVQAIRTLVETETGSGHVLGFLCGGCGYPAGDAAAASVAETGVSYPASFLPVRIPCGGRLDTLYVLEAFRAGFDAVAVFRCREGHCRNLIGNLDMDRRINLLRTVLRSRGIDDSRLRIIDISPSEGERFVEQVNELHATLGELAHEKGGPL